MALARVDMPETKCTLTFLYRRSAAPCTSTVPEVTVVIPDFMEDMDDGSFVPVLRNVEDVTIGLVETRFNTEIATKHRCT
jgi:hypothetical protein